MKSCKIAVSGKGGVGKSTLAAALCLLMAKSGKSVLAVDADPDANLGACLGLTAEEQKAIVPISEQRALIEERTGAKVKQYGQMFKLNPHVSDIADGYAFKRDGIALLVLGAIEKGGSGCACPENVLIRALVTDLLLQHNEALVLDMEAGIEHLGRGTARGVDTLIVVGDIGLTNIKFVANKVASDSDERFIREALGGRDILGVIPYCEDVRQTDRNGKSVLDGINAEVFEVFNVILRKIL